MNSVFFFSIKLSDKFDVKIEIEIKKLKKKASSLFSLFASGSLVKISSIFNDLVAKPELIFLKKKRKWTHTFFWKISKKKLKKSREKFFFALKINQIINNKKQKRVYTKRKMVHKIYF